LKKIKLKNDHIIDVRHPVFSRQMLLEAIEASKADTEEPGNAFIDSDASSSTSTSTSTTTGRGTRYDDLVPNLPKVTNSCNLH
jgi:hypothetical protein